MRLRYSLRALFVFVTLVCLGVGWLALPTIRAQQFVAAIERKDYAAAERLFAEQEDTFPGSFKQHQHFEPRVSLKPLTWHDLVHRERNLYVAVTYGDGTGIAGCGVEVRSTASGLEVGMMAP
jgi:hypothetical protein